MAGPTMGLGLGLGVNLDLNLIDPTKFSVPLHTTRVYRTMDDSESKAFIFGVGETRGANDEQKSKDGALGVGYHSTQRGVMMFKVKRSSDFMSSGLYEHMELPREINY